jgi:hypothetical protein
VGALWYATRVDQIAAVVAEMERIAPGRMSVRALDDPDMPDWIAVSVVGEKGRVTCDPANALEFLRALPAGAPVGSWRAASLKLEEGTIWRAIRLAILKLQAPWTEEQLLAAPRIKPFIRQTPNGPRLYHVKADS